MSPLSEPTGRIRAAVALLLALSLLTVVVTTAVPPLSAHVVAQDADDEDAGDIDEDDDDNAGHGNDDDGVDEDNPGNGKDKDKDKDKKDKKDKKNAEDDEDDFVTAVPTRTTAPDAEPTSQVLTPVSTPTASASLAVTTGTLQIRLRACPDGTDPSVGTDALRDACLDGSPDAEFELAGRSGIYSGWRRAVTTDVDGDANVANLGAGTYTLTLDDLDWCAAEASNVADGLIVIEPAETTEVTAYLCTELGTPSGS